MVEALAPGSHTVAHRISLWLGGQPLSGPRLPDPFRLGCPALWCQPLPAPGAQRTMHPAVRFTAALAGERLPGCAGLPSGVVAALASSSGGSIADSSRHWSPFLGLIPEAGSKPGGLGLLCLGSQWLVHQTDCNHREV
jgi:hypothetical protein